MTEPVSIEVLYYQMADAKRPVEEWLNELTADKLAFAAIQTRIDRIERGLIGDWKSIGGGVETMKRGNVPAAVPHRDYLLKRLTDSAVAAAYLNAAVKEDDPAAFLQALRNVVDASGGIAKIAERTDLNRQAIYRMLSENGNPEFKSLQRLLSATGLELNVTAEQEGATHRTQGRAAQKERKKHRTKSAPLKQAA